LSNQRECMIFENEPGEWYYALESDFADGNEHDWRDDASAYGPFATYDIACEHLASHHSNPGGHTMLEYAEFKGEKDSVTDRLVADAAENMKAFQRSTPVYRRW
jgi:hypothetical protein